ncbi:MAG: anthranilate phosphoribosyltransferase [Henriciella sp.]|nr:anthranilate phosphoribosyltransferase [Henriciella sp.]
MTDSLLAASIKALARSEPLSSELLEGAFAALLSGEAEPEQIGAFLMGLAVRGETSAELLAGAKVMRANARSIDLDGDVLDTCGTGGLPWTSLNTSTASAIVIAACGGKVAKHGNRSVPPKTGSADVLEALGVELDLTEARFRKCLDTAGVGFLFARTHHSAMRHVAPVRASLGIRTIFNLLGPLSNPAGATHQILGVYEPRWLKPMAETLRDLGIKRAWVVHGPDAATGGIDELSVAGPTQVVEVANGALTELTIVPEDAGLSTAPLAALQGGNVDENALAIRELFEGRTGPFRDAVVLNAAAGLYILGLAADLKAGAEQATAALDSGAALKTLTTLAEASRGGMA